MTEVLFYHLQSRSLEQVLPTLLERSLERGWRIVVQSSSDDRVEALDAHLWIYRDDSFLPHGTDKDGNATEHQVLLTADDDNRNGANVRFLVDGAPMPASVAAYHRVVLLFDGDDPDAVAAAREHWSAAKAQGLETTYWQPDERGRWQRKG